MGRKKRWKPLTDFCATCSCIAVCGCVVLFIGSIICLIFISHFKMIENTSCKNSGYLLHIQSANSLYKYYIFCCCRLPLQCFQFLLHSQLWEEYCWPTPKYKPSFINSIMEQSMAFPWTAFLCIPLPLTASSKRVQCLCLCVSVHLHLKAVPTFVLLSCSLQTQPAQTPSNACSDSTFDDLVCYLLFQNVKIAWGRLERQHWEILKMKMKHWVFCMSLNAFHNTCMMERWNPAPLKKEHGDWWCQQSKHLGPPKLHVMVLQCYSEDKHESCRSYGDGGIRNRVADLHSILWGLN